MTDSNARDRLDAKHDRDREQRIERIKRWVAYIESNPPELWGPQQNAIVDDQLDAAQRVRTSVSHKQRVTDLAAEIVEMREEDDESE